MGDFDAIGSERLLGSPLIEETRSARPGVGVVMILGLAFTRLSSWSRWKGRSGMS